MRIEVLGSGGAHTVPRAFCKCNVCRQAGDNPAPPYVRHGPSLFVHDLDLLIDTPEEIRIQLNRSGIERVETALYTHWHPDHTAGVRVFESNYSVVSLVDRSVPPHTTTVVLPERVAETFASHHALSEKLAYLEQYHLVAIDRVLQGESRVLGRWRVTPVEMPDNMTVAYLFEGPSRVFICMDEIYGYQPDGLGDLDLAILPCGFFLKHPITGEQIIAEDHPVLMREPTFEQTVDIARQIAPRRVVFLHLNHGLGLTPENFDEVAARLADDDSLPPIEFAYDTMMINVNGMDQ